MLSDVYERAKLHPVPMDRKLIRAQQHTADVDENAGVIAHHLDVTSRFDTNFQFRQ